MDDIIRKNEFFLKVLWNDNDRLPPMWIFLLEKLTRKVKTQLESDKDYKISGIKTETWKMILKTVLKNWIKLTTNLTLLTTILWKIAKLWINLKKKSENCLPIELLNIFPKLNPFSFKRKKSMNLLKPNLLKETHWMMKNKEELLTSLTNWAP